MKIWVAGIPGAWSSQKLASALNRLGVESTIFSLSECLFSISDGKVFWGGKDLSQLDGIVVRKLGDAADPLSHYRINLLYQLCDRGVKVFSSPSAIEEANNRYRMTVKLSQAGVAVPDTLITESVEQAILAVESWGRVVLKPLFTSKGRGMVLLNSEGAYRLTLKHWQDIGRFPFYLQRYIANHYDVGIAILDSRLLGAYKRVAGEHWQTTTREGGHYESFSPSEKIAGIALKAANVFGLDYTVVDIVPDGDNYLVYEVSAFGGFSGLEVCGVDAATLYAEYVVSQITKAEPSNARA